MAGKWNDVIYDVALAGTFACTSGRTGMLLLEFNLGALAALDTGIGNLAGQCQHHGKQEGESHCAIVPMAVRHGFPKSGLGEGYRGGGIVLTEFLSQPA